MFATRSGRKVVMVEDEELQGEAGYLLDGLTAADKGNNKWRSLQVDFEKPHQLAAITFPKVKAAKSWLIETQHVMGRQIWGDLVTNRIFFSVLYSLLNNFKKGKQGKVIVQHSNPQSTF